MQPLENVTTAANNMVSDENFIIHPNQKGFIICMKKCQKVHIGIQE
jgi:hypothetical protein